MSNEIKTAFLSPPIHPAHTSIIGFLVGCAWYLIPGPRPDSGCGSITAVDSFVSVFRHVF